MGMGSDSAAGLGAEATGMQAGAGSGTGSGIGGLGSIMGMLGNLFGGGAGGAKVDPESVKSIAKVVGDFGSTMASMDKVPPHTKQMIGQAIKQAQQQKAQQDALNPYGGDMMRYITPDMARGVLDAHGIPYGRMSVG
jgi:proteasome assembly chaperone (PAC2) family protein